MTNSATATRTAIEPLCSLPPEGEFKVLHAEVRQERALWLRQWHAWPNREPFAHPAYVEAFLAPGEKAVCATQARNGSGVLLPMVIRSIGEEAWAGDVPYKDVTTPYGYGGAFAWGAVNPASFWDAFDGWAMQENIVSLFARLSLFPSTLLPFRGESSVAMENVVRSLDLN